jgi:hypothetical protein
MGGDSPVRLTTVRTRTWSERLLSKPWRPWRAVESTTYNVTIVRWRVVTGEDDFPYIYLEDADGGVLQLPFEVTMSIKLVKVDGEQQ